MTEFPMRINKYLAHKGISTRKEADNLIGQGKVFINNRIAILGDKVLEKDKVVVKGNNNTKYVYLAYNKQKGVVTVNPQYGEISIKHNPTIPKNVFPIGRLDKNSRGLIILTNDGRVTDKLLNPKYDHEKEYTVELNRAYSPAFIKHMTEGVLIGDYKTKPTKISKINDTKFSITLTEGKNRQIRRMTEKLGYTVLDLLRTRIQNIKIGKTASGSYREIEGEEKEKFLETLGLN